LLRLQQYFDFCIYICAFCVCDALFSEFARCFCLKLWLFTVFWEHKSRWQAVFNRRQCLKSFLFATKCCCFWVCCVFIFTMHSQQTNYCYLLLVCDKTENVQAARRVNWLQSQGSFWFFSILHMFVLLFI
jgi:hypothetical protein